MRQVRRSVFETNSSSTHSVTIRHKGLAQNCITVHNDGYIHTSLGEFGWEVVNYRDQEDKLSYLVTMLAEKNGIDTWYRSDDSLKDKIDKLMETKDFKQLSKEIGKHAKCRGVVIDQSEGYIDHQSHEDYRTLQDFLDDYGTDIVEFVFGRGNVVHTDNDNH